MQEIKLHDKTFCPFITGDKIEEAVKQIARRINCDYEGKTPLFVAVLNGSFMFAADLMRHIEIPCEISFIKLASYHGTGSTGEVKNLIGLTEKVSGKDLVIVEDIVDTGLTLKKIILELEKESPTSISVATCLFKPKAYRFTKEISYAAIEVGNEFLVGYGLDYDGLGRNLNDIYIINE
ncbi:MAG: hypoxanthine phosphoribosyltransferase [Flavobacteriales bacterium]